MQPVKLILAALLICLPAGATVTRTVTIDHTKVGASDSTNFPVLFTGTYSYLATVANGGLVQNASGFDVEFFSDVGLTTKLPWETELYTAATGQVAYWINVPTLSHTVDTVIYLAYGNASITTDQSNKTGTWNSNFTGVYHLQQSAGPYLDSTTHAINSTAGTHPTSVTSTLFGGTVAQSFVTASSQAITFGSGTPLDTSIVIGGTGWGAAIWFLCSNTTRVNNMFDFRGLSGVGGPTLYLNTSGFYQWFDGPSNGPFIGSTNLADGNWHYIVVTNQSKIYIDGNLITTVTTFATAGNGGGFFGNDYAGDFATITIQDEQFIGKVAVTADWVTASYNNQKTPSTFYALGFPVGGGTSRHKVIEE